MKRILLIGNSELVIFGFRKEFVEELIKGGYEVFVCFPITEFGSGYDTARHHNCHYIPVEISSHGTNPITDMKFLISCYKIFQKVQPDTVFTYTIKPNIYGAMACRILNIPCVATITGLGTAVENASILQKLIVLLYRIAFSKVQMVFFQNEENMKFFTDRNLPAGKYGLISGSGVNLDRFALQEYPGDETVEFVFIARIMKEKGIDHYLEAAQMIRKKYPDTVFHVCGFCESTYQEKLQSYIEDGSVVYHGLVSDIRKIHKQIHCVIHPTYYPEGLSNVLLEACASGRPIITTDRSGCREVVEDGVNGFIVKQQDTNDLIYQIERFLALSHAERHAMGLAGRRKVELQFDRKDVVQKYMAELRNYNASRL